MMQSSFFVSTVWVFYHGGNAKIEMSSLYLSCDSLQMVSWNVQVNFKLQNNHFLPVSVWLPMGTYTLACVHPTSFRESSGRDLYQAVLDYFTWVSTCVCFFHGYLKCLEKEKYIKPTDYVLASTIRDDTLIWTKQYI